MSISTPENIAGFHAERFETAILDVEEKTGRKVEPETRELFKKFFGAGVICMADLAQIRLAEYRSQNIHSQN